MGVKVLSFGKARDIIGESEISIENVFTLNDLVDRLHNLYPKLSLNSQYQWAVNEEYTQDLSKKINNLDVVAIIPPVSGG